MPISILHVTDKSSLSYLKFITITFDPDKFGSVNEDIREKEYILSVLYRLKSYYTFIYGCFEYHKSGTVHSHLIMHTSVANMKQMLRPYFTNNPKNKIVIDVGPAKMPQSITYINKESKDFYYYNVSDVVNPVDDNELSD